MTELKFANRLTKLEILEFLNSVNIYPKKIKVDIKLNGCLGSIGLNITYFITPNHALYATCNDYSFIASTKCLNLSSQWVKFLEKKFGKIYINSTNTQSK